MRRASFLLSCLLAAASLLASAAPALPQGAPKATVAVMELDALGATKDEASAITDRLREELLKSGRIAMVDRAKLADVLQVQADQQATCTGSAAQCALQVGKLLGVNKLVSGKVTKFGAEAWQISATLVDVETAQTLKAESVRFRGDILSLLDKAVPELATKLGG